MTSSHLSLEQVLKSAVILHGKGQMEDAERLYLEVLKSDPKQPVALYYSGVLAHQRKRYQDAIQFYTRAVQSAPHYAEAHCNLGIALKEMGHLDQAIKSYEQAIQYKPDFVEAHNNLGNALQQNGDPEAAVGCYQKAVALKPDYLDAWLNMAGVFLDKADTRQAERCFGRVLELAPENTRAHNGLGAIRQLNSDLIAAEKHFRDAIEASPDNADAHFNLCDVLEKTNRHDELDAILESLEAQFPDDPRLALQKALLLVHKKAYDETLSLLEVIGDTAADRQYQIIRSQLMAQMHDRLGAPGLAYELFEKSNRLTAESAMADRGNAQNFIDLIDNCERAFTKEWVSTWPDVKPSGSRPAPVFLVGFPRSGTTLLDTILMGHSKLAVSEERPAITAVRRFVESNMGTYPDCLAELEPQQIDELRDLYFREMDDELKEQTNNGLIVDKNPLNMVDAGLIYRLFPDAHFLFMERHPCDCVLSCFMQRFGINDATANFLTLQNTALFYDRIIALWHQYAQMLPLSIHRVRYERLVDDFEGEVGALLAFIGVDWEEGVRSYTETASRRKTIRTPSYNQVTQPIYARAKGRWTGYRKQLEPVMPRLRPWLKRMGYAE